MLIDQEHTGVALDEINIVNVICMNVNVALGKGTWSWGHMLNAFLSCERAVSSHIGKHMPHTWVRHRHTRINTNEQMHALHQAVRLSIYPIHNHIHTHAHTDAHTHTQPHTHTLTLYTYLYLPIYHIEGHTNTLRHTNTETRTHSGTDTLTHSHTHYSFYISLFT